MRTDLGNTATLWRGQVDDPPWARPASLVLLTATGVLYLPVRPDAGRRVMYSRGVVRTPTTRE